MEMQLFKHQKLGSVRVVIKDGEPWFVAKDVCAILGNDISYVRKCLDPDEHRPLGRHEEHTTAPNEFEDLRCNTQLINESGLYHMLASTRKPAAKPFRRWVTADVFPAIRQTGPYAIPQNLPATFDIPKTLPDALRAYAMEVEKNEELRIAIDIANGDRDKAIAQRAYISSKREASVMGKLGARNRQIRRYASEYRTMSKDLSDRSGEIRELRDRLIEKDERIIALESARAIRELSGYEKDQLKDLTRESKNLKSQLANLNELLDEANQELTELRTFKDNSDASLTALQRQIDALKQRNDDLIKDNAFLRSGGASDDMSLEEARRQVHELRVRLGEDGEYFTLQNWRWTKESGLVIGYYRLKVAALNAISSELGYPVRTLSTALKGSVTAWHKDVFTALQDRQAKNSFYIKTFSPEHVFKATKGKR